MYQSRNQAQRTFSVQAFVRGEALVEKYIFLKFSQNFCLAIGEFQGVNLSSLPIDRAPSAGKNIRGFASFEKRTGFIFAVQPCARRNT